MLLVEMFKPTMIELSKPTIRPIVQYEEDDTDNLVFMDGMNVRFMDGDLFELMEQEI